MFEINFLIQKNGFKLVAHELIPLYLALVGNNHRFCCNILEPISVKDYFLCSDNRLTNHWIWCNITMIFFCWIFDEHIQNQFSSLMWPNKRKWLKPKIESQLPSRIPKKKFYTRFNYNHSKMNLTMLHKKSLTFCKLLDTMLSIESTAVTFMFNNWWNHRRDLLN